MLYSYISVAVVEAVCLQLCLSGLQLEIYHPLIQHPLCLIVTQKKPPGSSAENDDLPLITPTSSF